MFIASAGAVLWLQLDRPVTTVRVLGQLTAEEQTQVRDALRPLLSGGLLSVDLNAAASALADLSWPRDVSVRRVWPDGLEVRLEKALVVAAWNEGYLTMGGDVVQLASAEPGLVNFDCELTRPQAALELYQRLQREVAPADLKIERLRENALGEWTLTFDNALVLTLGDTDLDERLERFIAVYRTALSDRLPEIERVDARYANGIAVSWRPEDAALVADAGHGAEIADNYARPKHGF
jgi:cell division protein FtsQ